MRVRWQSFSFDVSGDWSAIEDPECLSLTLSEEGALQASSAVKQAGDVTDVDLLFKAEERSAWGQAMPAQCGEFEGISYEYESEGTAWRRWFLRKGRLLLFVTYNGTPAAAARERVAVLEVLSTARMERR
jgi:hypothetical protein